MSRIAIINPAFEVSYWGLEYSQPLFGKKANMPVASLPLLAALTPPEHEVVLFDENVETLDFEELETFDIVALTGMSVQRFRMDSIVSELKDRGCFVVIGGPWVTVEEDYFGDRADVIFIGEAEDTWPRFLKEWQDDEHQHRYEQTEKTEMATVPTPRHDLLKNKHYLVGSLQISRGCPFQCEFCDIIVTFGRRPRIKQASQVTAELDSLLGQGMHIVFIVDDNLIGNKAAIKPVLREVAAWQQKHGYPIVFSTEASLDLCEDDELMELMAEANIQSVFIGLESPDEESLKETKKYQNVRSRGGTMLDKVHRIQDFGLEVWCGLIVGFDNDTSAIFATQQKFLKDSRIAHAMVGLLHAIPKTPLHARLLEEGRLDLADEHHFGTNVIPKGMTRDELLQGYLETMRNAYEPDVYFDRLDQLFVRDRFEFRALNTDYFQQHPWQRRKQFAIFTAGFVAMFIRLMWKIPDADLRRTYRRQIWGAVRKRFTSPDIYFFYVLKCAMHYHHHRMTTEMIDDPSKFVSSYGKAMRSDQPVAEKTSCQTVPSLQPAEHTGPLASPGLPVVEAGSPS
ncbi:B12-binding domain-containing radical SAM protein [Rhodopirellula sp. P2]|uniref:B12-binding domain-containing radical SAM protein n=1 Tax=Rhodopirellula sp. P2 TaxID=2127060 RepID=UPI002367CB68|nr:B12-binding domain-containing radical SAM protein [Rhodopirellula sp. P2]WDQ19339.1 B12-binding domain-containing radical SAM protein [Rhodopirellula sp. P2]